MNNEFVKDLSKKILNDGKSTQELSPGTVGRRYEPTLGTAKHNERIHRESRRVDHYKNLPYTFSKPSRPKGRLILIECNNCGNITSGTTVTVGIICKECGKFSTVTEVEQ